MPEEELSKKITEEAEQYIPFDINDLALDYQVLGKVNGNGSNPKNNDPLMKSNIPPWWRLFWLQCKEILLTKEQTFFLEQD